MTDLPWLDDPLVPGSDLIMYHRDGTPAKTRREGYEILGNRWTKGTPDRGRVAATSWGKKQVSTVFLAIDHGFGHHRPILFETLVFQGGGMGEIDGRRYATEREALIGHRVYVREHLGRLPLALYVLFPWYDAPFPRPWWERITRRRRMRRRNE